VDLWWEGTNFYSFLDFTVDLDPETLDENEVIEEDDSLLVP
jgi:hypothetical protein